MARSLLPVRSALAACATAFAVAALSAAPAPAFANGRKAAVVDVHFRPGHPTDIYAQVTFGLLVSHDGGATWHHTCEAAIGYGGTYDPHYAVSPTGKVFVTTFDGFRVATDSCTWAASTVPSPFVSDVAIGPDGAIYAGAADTTESRIFKSTNDGLTFVPTGAAGNPTGDWWATIRVAPSNGNRVYATGYRFVGTPAMKQVFFFRSDNGGTSWAPMATTAFAFGISSNLEIAAISPDDADMVFARVTVRPNSSGDAIYRSVDGGTSWTLVSSLDGAGHVVVRKVASGVVPKTSAQVVIAAASPIPGTFVSTDGGKTFATTPATTLMASCLEESEQGALWLCVDAMDPMLPTMAIAKSATAGNFTKVVTIPEIKGPEPCPAGTLQHDVCQVEMWCALKQQLMITSNEVACAADADGVAVDAGNGGDNGSTTKPGCCDTGRGGGDPVGAGLLGLVSLIVLRRRRA